MTPPALDRDVVGNRLRLIRETLDEMTALADRDAADLAARPIERAAAERFIQVNVDLAVDVNSHLLVALTGAVSPTGRKSFVDLAAKTGVLSTELAAALAPSAGMRNLLVHRYGDIDVGEVSAAISTVLDLYARYVTAVSRWLDELG